MSVKSGSIDALDQNLKAVNHMLTQRALERTRGEVEHAYDFINKLADDGVIDIECGSCGDPPEEKPAE